ncbi:uncharacterized protein P174DRAFT_430767 [Aspergillus novofumigatus IBT 16806]|uniref:Uncharacterized protein n=1 Tax=Aspergillus novofumigatus (strain IBT 16806) TaxID=1392255 RepID=A0A2I1C822_ASPN1|nr:uncharacterized protein P174DRAFT_430767 [Aspergillus novofumigatus IBT 16806]PKX93782.1 hypothetical protein P174DRAFT_430767 [Aspergillus novofumigatus IBT 16806]
MLCIQSMVYARDACTTAPVKTSSPVWKMTSIDMVSLLKHMLPLPRRGDPGYNTRPKASTLLLQFSVDSTVEVVQSRSSPHEVEDSKSSRCTRARLLRTSRSQQHLQEDAFAEIPENIENWVELRNSQKLKETNLSSLGDLRSGSEINPA